MSEGEILGSIRFILGFKFSVEKSSPFGPGDLGVHLFSSNQLVKQLRGLTPLPETNIAPEHRPFTPKKGKAN